MPVTRSQKDAPQRSLPVPAHTVPTLEPRQPAEQTEEEEATSASASSGTEATEESSGTAASEETTATDATVTSKASKPEQKKMMDQKKKAADQKTPEDPVVQQADGSAWTLIPVGASRRARSTRTTSSTARRRELEAREELARRELEQAQAAAKLARVRLELAQCEDEDSVVEDQEDQEDRTAQVQNWIQNSMLEEKEVDQPELRGHPPPEDPPVVKPEQKPTNGGAATVEVQALAEAIKEAFSAKGGPPPQPKYIHELPFFDGNSSEWTAFKVVYEDTAPMFTEAQNMARLRKALKGNAREAFKSLLYSEASPADVMQALRRRYGRPDALVLAELEKVKALSRITENPREICIFASQVNNSVSAIKGLKKPQYLHSPEMVKQIIDKMPSILRFRWYDYTANSKDGDYSDLTLISEFLNQEADKCGAFATSEERSGPRRTQRHTTHAAREEGTRVKRTCAQCQGEHHLPECQAFLRLGVQERWALIKKSHICFKCLLGRHRKESCRKPPCKVCRRWHHYLLHAEAGDEQKIPEEDHKRGGERDVATNIAAPVNTAKTAKAYLKMIPVEVYGAKGSQKIMALMDEGSTVSLLDATVADNIGASGEQEELVIETVGGRVIRKQDSQRLNLTIRGIHQNEKRTLERVRTMDNLKLTPQFLNRSRIEEFPHLKKMAEVLYYEAESPQLLIGQDNWQLIVSQEIKKGKPGQPVASRTELGWVLHGADSSNIRTLHFLNSCLHVNTTEEDMHQVIKDHFAIESLGVQPRRPTTDSEGKALAILDKTCKRLADGRFEAGLLWKREDDDMPESYSSAEKRLKNIERKIDRDPQLKEEYCSQIQHLLDSHYAEEAPQDSASRRTWYLPHFPVVHPLKKKIRIVFDAAAKSRGKSLNDALLPGPDLLQSLFGVLLRFRQGPLAVAADIKEMFLQIKIRPEDRDSLRFLWRGKERDATPKVYRMTSVIFGATSSPSTAIFVKNRNAADYQDKYPEAARAIEVNHYMDDYLQSFHSTEQMHKVTKEVDFIHKKAGFELRGWASNRPELLQEMQGTATEKKEVEIGEKEEKTLGLRWLVEEDALGFRANLRNSPEEVTRCYRTPTKREVTSAVMSTFDPLGLVSPVLIQGKKLLQGIWRSGIGWDEEIEQKENEEWKSYLNNMQLLKDLRVPRCLAPNCTEGELHVFTDASESAYAAAVYWRTKNLQGTYDTYLIAAKARVTPLKPVSIPRLELQAALLGSRLAHSVEQELELNVAKKTYWTDSSIVLSWIKTDPRTFKTFVAHRLAEIEDLTTPQQWRWVPTAQNPADDATRSIPENFSHTHRWFVGPDFLRYDEDQWPANRRFQKETTGEEKTTNAVSTVNIVYKEATPDPEGYSSWKRLWRVTARVLQFLELCKQKRRVYAARRNDDPTWRKQQKKTPAKHKPAAKQRNEPFIPIGAELLERAQMMLLKRSQNESFGDDIRHMKQGKPLNSGSKLRKLDVELKDDLVRLKGRIDAVQGISLDYKKPIVLDSKNKIAALIIQDYHERFNHGNHSTVMNEIRQQYWILGLRSAIRAMQHRCQWCKVKRAKPQEIPTGNLPAERLHHGAFPFTCTGVDYFGPMTITVARRHEKRWGALFTCLTTRAVHIELTPSLSTDSMIMALRRFAARRGTPRTIYSDNGTNFVGANKELREALETLKTEELAYEAEKIGVQWKFIPPGAPNMGGAWERLVRSVKTALDATLKERHPREEVLHTLLLEAEHMVNSRPLTEIAGDPQEEALTPNHFLIGRSCGAPRVGAFQDSELVGRDTWKATQRLADHFWQRWLREYLPTLLPRKISGRAVTSELRVGDIVLIVDPSSPRCVWPRGRILEVYPGPDGRTRIVDVETRGGVLRRPSSRIVLLVPGDSPRPEGGATHEGENVGD